MRLGYYPADPELVKRISGFLKWPADKPAILLDPCCGQGEALAHFGPAPMGHPQSTHEAHMEHPRIFRYAIELATSRHAVAAERLGAENVLYGGFEHAQISERCFSAMWLNPPYDDELGGGMRTELRFLQKATHLLAEGGVVVFLFSYRALNDRMCKFLHSYYDEIRMFDHPVTDRSGYADVQVKIVIAKRRRMETSPPADYWLKCEPFPEVEADPPAWTVPPGRVPVRWFMGGFTDEQLCDLADRSSLWQQNVRNGPVNIGQPLLPPKLGHIPMILASGRLNGCIHDHYARARIDKYFVTIERKVDEKGDATGVEVQRQKLRLSIKCLAKRDGRVTIVSFGETKLEDAST